MNERISFSISTELSANKEVAIRGLCANETAFYNMTPFWPQVMTTATPVNRVLHFGAFTLNVTTGKLRKNDVRVKLRPQAAKVLSFLASRHGETVRRKQIKEEIWGTGFFVDFDHGLNLCIRQIRAALNDDAEKPRYI